MMKLCPLVAGAVLALGCQRAAPPLDRNASAADTAPAVLDAAASADASARPTVTRSTAHGARTFATAASACTITLEVYELSSINAGGASLRRDCDIVGERDIEALSALIGAAREEGRFAAVKTLALHGMGGPAGVMHVRLALAARASSSWDLVAGKPKGSDNLNRAVAELAASDALFPEGQRAFRANDSCLRKASVEKVDVQQVSELPAAKELVANGAKPSDRVPWSSMVWYEVAHGSACNAQPDDAGARGAADTLTLDVRGSYCSAADKDKPGCRSYTYVLDGAGSFRGSARKSIVPSDEVDALFRDASAAFAEKHSCIPYAPDKGDRRLTLKVEGKTHGAAGACGARLDAIASKLEKLAAQR